MKSYRVTFETAHWHMGVLPIFFRPQYEVKAKYKEEAKEKWRSCSHENIFNHINTSSINIIRIY